MHRAFNIDFSSIPLSCTLYQIFPKTPWSCDKICELGKEKNINLDFAYQIYSSNNNLNWYTFSIDSSIWFSRFFHKDGRDNKVNHLLYTSMLFDNFFSNHK